jgi:acyl carrier protein phosphodiesterase
MNFLGHLYFSNGDVQLMHANLLGDFIKGKDLSRFPEIIRRGVKLHRTIDNYIDTHPLVKELLHELHEPLPKISGIAVDLYFDHLLAKNWSAYHSQDLYQFVQDFYHSTSEHAEHQSVEYNFMISKMKELDWLYNYRTHEGLTYACKGLSRRISFENSLGLAPDVYLEKEEVITLAFNKFMAEAIPYFEDYFKNN